jgi:hypothetical protein
MFKALFDWIWYAVVAAVLSLFLGGCVSSMDGTGRTVRVVLGSPFTVEVSDKTERNQDGSNSYEAKFSVPPLEEYLKRETAADPPE